MLLIFEEQEKRKYGREKENTGEKKKNHMQISAYA